MVIDNELEARIRSLVVELVDSAPLPPALPHLDALDAGGVALSVPLRRGHRVLWVGLTVLGAAVVGILSLLAVVLSGSSGSVITEATLGMQVAGYTTPALQPAPPSGYEVVASGTAFGRPWVVAGTPPSSGRLSEWLAYDGKSLISGSSPLTPTGSPPSWFSGPHAHAHMSLGVGQDNQRFLVGATDGPVATVTVQAKNGTTVTASVLPHRLGTISFFVLSLGRQGDCYQLCQGAVTVSLTNGKGRVLTTQKVPDFGGVTTYLDTPPVTVRRK